MSAYIAGGSLVLLLAGCFGFAYRAMKERQYKAWQKLAGLFARANINF